MLETMTPLGRVVDYLRRVGESSSAAELSDGQLIERFLRDGSDTAFAALVHRHGPMVFGVCRRFLPRVHDAEDAFQATFLVLARRASSILARDNVAGWLYGVACRVAMKARAYYWKRQHREKQVDHLPDVPQTTETAWDDVKAVVDEELNRLPDKYRGALVLCDLEGHTQQEAAKQLGIPEGTVSSRLTRGRKLLAERLTRRGVTLSASTLAVSLLAQHARAGLSYLLVSVTVQGVMDSLPGSTAAGHSFSQNVIHLAQGASSSMTKKTILAACGLAIFLTVVYGLASALADRNSGGPALSAKVETPQNAGGQGGGKQPDHTTPIVNKAIQALGDPKLQAKYKGITLDLEFKTTENGIDMKFESKWSALGYDKCRAEITISDNKGTQQAGVLVVNGKNGWVIKSQKLETAPEKELLPLLVVLHAIRFSQKPGEMLAKEFKLSPLGEIPIKDQTAVGVKIEQEGLRDINMYFDKKTGLPLKCEFSFPKGPGSNDNIQAALVFSDYKQFGGIQHFTKMTVVNDQNKIMTVELSNVQHHETIKEEQFAKPAVP